MLADENRLRILLSLEGGQKSVSSIIEATQLSQTLVSYHLRTLRDEGLVKTERRGPFVLYSLTHEDLPAWVSGASRFVLMGEKSKDSQHGVVAVKDCCTPGKSVTPEPK
ncbi:helix-turn-helix transcriptional regulator [Alicyclobacillus sp. SP_1]|uniref:ArsR/SmtB family transcription factor n=1 Tax=Alicyclobacillus sp. SP_1 TaxID=2942475 RepID=UPI0021586377|nr:metalloregulator ArsR/SmtB family transcription factor [Alicyclobacillus sp. SP_1]